MAARPPRPHCEEGLEYSRGLLGALPRLGKKSDKTIQLLINDRAWFELASTQEQLAECDGEET